MDFPEAVPVAMIVCLPAWAESAARTWCRHGVCTPKDAYAARTSGWTQSGHGSCTAAREGSSRTCTSCSGSGPEPSKLISDSAAATGQFCHSRGHRPPVSGCVRRLEDHHVADRVPAQVLVEHLPVVGG